METSEIIGDSPCPKCRSSGRDTTGNHLIHFSNGNKYCNRCGYKEIKGKKMTEKTNLEEIANIKPGGDIPDRKLQSAFTELYELRQGRDPTSGEVDSYFFPLYEVGTGKLLGYQKRKLPKMFSFLGDIKKKKLQFIGQHLARENGKFLIIVEGGLDTIAAKQMLSQQRKSWTVVGALSTSAKKQFQDNIEWLNGFDTIVLAFDQDDAGQKAVQSIMTTIPPYKVRIAKFSENDPCDMLIADKSAEFVHSLSAAKKFQPEGIVGASSVVEEYLKIRHIKGTPFPPEWELVNKKTGGVRPGEIVVYTAGTGVGKSQLCDEVVSDLLQRHPEEKVGIVKMEHNNAVGLASILSVGMQVNLKKYSDSLTDDQLREEWNKLFTDGEEERAFLINHGFTGISDDNSFLAKLMGLIVGSGCTTIIIDHLHAVMSETGSDNDDVDSLMYDLQRMTQQYQVKTHIVMHLRKTGTGGKSFETGEVPTLDDLKGSGALKQVPDTIIAVARDTQSTDDVLRRVAQIAVLKNRWLGDTGLADKLIYDVDKSKYFPFDDSDYESELEKANKWNMRIS